MTYEREEYLALRQEQAEGRLNAQRSSLEAVAQQAVKAEHLTGDPHWDTFLSYIAAAIETTRVQLEDWRRKMEDPTLVNGDDLALCKIGLLQCRERIRAWEAVVALPKDLKEAGEKARGLLERIGDE